MKAGTVFDLIRSAFPAGAGYDEMFAFTREAGFDGVELQHGEPPRDFTEHSPDEALLMMRAAAEAAGVEIHSVMPTAQEIASPDKAQQKAAVEVLGRVAEQAALLGASTVLIVPGRVKEDAPYDAVFSAASEGLKRLAERTAAVPVVLAVENIWNKFLYSPLEFAQFVDGVGAPNVKAYFDVGNIMLFGFPEQWIRILGPRVDRVHVKDYRRDAPGAFGFCNLLEGDVPWAEVVKALKDIGYNGYLTAEVAGYRTDKKLGAIATAKALKSIIGAR
ncbi:MAG TPA: sugar phosphate isomerase/epimerase [Planctomycetes bacterium]|nr:sugar phosphate isomerase/epimerase [Planctomycetota bacterium]